MATTPLTLFILMVTIPILMVKFMSPVTTMAIQGMVMLLGSTAMATLV